MYISTKSEILCSFVSRYYDPTFVFISLRFFFFFISVGLSQRVGGRGLSPATFIENKRKIEPDELSGYTIPLLLIAYARQLVASFLLSFPFLRVYHKFSIPTYMLPSYLTSEGRKVTFCPLLIPPLPSPFSSLPSLISSPLSPKEGLILRLLRLRSESNSPSQPFFIYHMIFL